MTTTTINRPTTSLAVVEWMTENAAKSDFASSLLSGYQRYGSLTMKQEAAVLRIIERDSNAPENPVTEIGIYAKIDEDGGIDIFRVKMSKSDNLYALMLDTATGEFEYQRGGIRNLTSDDRLTVEQAKAFGHMFGRCIVCGRDLSDPKSVEQGIGPVCIKRV